MKYLGFIIILLFSGVKAPLENVRNQFPNIVSLDEANGFLKTLENNNSPEAKGYMAAMILVKSRFTKNPFSKLKYFKKGKKMLDNNIAMNSTNIEIRYLRFLMQKQIPEFLGYNKNIDEDFNIIYNKLLASNIKRNFKLKILNTMLLVDDLSVSEKTRINKILNKI